MNEKMNIKTLLKTKQAILESKLSILIDHPVTKGDQCESAWIDYFRSFLPNKYAVDKGFVFDAEGNVSEQIDIIIYDALYTPLIFGTDSGEKFITAESVYAVFDSKPKIQKSTIEYTNLKISSVSKLKRSSRGMINAGQIVAPRALTHIIGGILAVDSIDSKNIKKYMDDYPYIDIGCAIKSTSFIVSRDNKNKMIDFKFSSSDESILSFFYIILDELYKLGTVAGIDIRNYSDTTLSSMKIMKEDL
ncbi:DUF6602 domain-containing protein [Anaerorhabdus sp.]|uniref:DUF6602 domain-containing protein n=1 Tax=Anaerorhabdus sp. TaxID=1872524 RepID=UPI002B1FFD66|nr:DUF6602 domain-containing protein [Anaerorhabdus sp.]MEA4874289.1 DUF6602 domain-containing protein [Anaerorhabdus sp.]